jgi:predicted RNase H-like HicB family nuclease
MAIYGEMVIKIGKGSKEEHRLTFERDEDGWWVATVHGVEGVHTQGRTTESTRERVLEAMRAAGYSNFTLTERVEIPAKLRKKVDAAKAARANAEKAQTTARATLRDAIRSLTDGLGVSLRDAAALLGISHQRAHQILGNKG